MGGWVRFLGFAIPLSIAWGAEKDPPIDATPRPGRCSFCSRARPFMYRLGDERWMCKTCLDDTVRLRTRRYSAQPRPVETGRPLETPHDVLRKPDRFDATWWNEQFA